MTGGARESIPDLAAMLARETDRAREAAERVDRAIDSLHEGDLDRFARAEARWLRAALAYLDHSLVDDDGDAALVQGRGLAEAEAAAWLAFVRSPAPAVAYLPRKVAASTAPSSPPPQGSLFGREG